MELKTYFAQDAAGNIISSAIVNVFLQGTTTLATGLTRADGTPLENPFAADGAGRIQFRAPDGYYDVQVSAGPGIIQTLTIQCVDYSGAKADADRAEEAADRADVSAEQAQNALNSITEINTNFEQNSREQWSRSLAEAGITLVSGSFEEGATVNSKADAVWHIAAGQCYSWDGAFPKSVPVGSTPETTGGIYQGAWVSVGDASLRSDLSSPDGDSLINHGDKTVQNVLNELLSVNVIDSNESPISSSKATKTIKNLAILQTGQSLAEGGVGYDQSLINQSVLNTNSFTLADGPVGIASAVLGTKLTNLRERIRSTIGSTLADKLITSGISKNVFFHGQAYGGKAYSEIKKGGSTGVYEKCITQAGSVKLREPSTVYRAIAFIHGEQDGINNNTSYADNISEWISDFNSDLKLITGQSEDIHGYLCQTASAGGYGFNGGISETTFPTPLQQLTAHKTNSLVTMVCSKYFLKYYDHAHITNKSQGILGEYYAKAIEYECRTGTKFEPCRPIRFTKTGNKVIIKFTGVEHGLSFDTEMVSPAANNGFSYSDAAGNSISSVSITGDDEVTITLSGNVGASPVVAYAYHNGSGGAVNQADGQGDRGNLRGTSKDTSKVTGQPLHPWCVIFREEI